MAANVPGLSSYMVATTMGGGVGGAAMGGGSALVANQHIGEGMWKGFLSGALSGAIGGAFGHWARGIKADSFWRGGVPTLPINFSPHVLALQLGARQVALRTLPLWGMEFGE